MRVYTRIPGNSSLHATVAHHFLSAYRVCMAPRFSTCQQATRPESASSRTAALQSPLWRCEEPKRPLSNRADRSLPTNRRFLARLVTSGANETRCRLVPPREPTRSVTWVSRQDLTSVPSGPPRDRSCRFISESSSLYK